MPTDCLRKRVLAGEILAGTFLKTPAHELIEVLARSGLDFLCLDAEHAPFDRARMDTCLAIGRACGFPLLVRVQAGRAEQILSALDCGAEGVVVPHVDSVEKATEIARTAHFGLDGRGFAGATRWAGFGGHSMGELIEKGRRETLVIAQIEEPRGVEAVEEIAAVEGIDALFLGPSDLSLAYGHESLDNPDLMPAYRRVGAACRAAGKGFITWVPNVEMARDLQETGVHVFLQGSEVGWMQAGARMAANALHGLTARKSD